MREMSDETLRLARHARVGNNSTMTQGNLPTTATLLCSTLLYSTDYFTPRTSIPGLTRDCEAKTPT